MKITLLEPLGIPAEVLARYQAGLEDKGHTFTAYSDKTTDPVELIRRTGDSDIAIIANNPYPAQVVAAASNLKMLDVAFTGIDHVALDACKEKGIMICNAAGYSTQCVAELAIGLTIACLRKMPACETATRNGGVGGPLRGREIGGRTVGIVGTGAIGTMTARLFQAFGAKVIAYSRTVRPEVEAMGVAYVSLEELMARSDIVSIHVPNNQETKGLISKERIAAMKPSALLINVARGAIVDNAALAEALNKSKLAGAGIDVFDMEPPIPEDYPLLHAKNTVLTPHVAFATDESMLRRAEIVFQNVEAYLAGNPENVCKL
ncbi:MAG: 2-hydroxyacid dehydrogenase [Clostridiales bacterium]|nr:2-hydroxyacid dehydrogenase [Clostridiales bacterium]MDY4172412.1 2-hydroxyacid dehydrogenase [Evtepia sp.]